MKARKNFARKIKGQINMRSFWKNSCIFDVPLFALRIVSFSLIVCVCVFQYDSLQSCEGNCYDVVKLLSLENEKQVNSPSRAGAIISIYSVVMGDIYLFFFFFFFCSWTRQANRLQNNIMVYPKFHQTNFASKLF